MIFGENWKKSAFKFSMEGPILLVFVNSSQVFLGYCDEQISKLFLQELISLNGNMIYDETYNASTCLFFHKHNVYQHIQAQVW